MVMPPLQNDRILSCDWGTSNFRLRLVDAVSAESIHEVVSGEGIAMVYNLWSVSGTDREQFYAAVLQKHIDVLEQRCNENLENVPLVISGMASSTLGISELGYANLPFSADGGSVNHRKINVDGFHHPIFLISGVRSENDVMRGEETQWVGLMQDKDFNTGDDLLFIMPGTHSKHLLVKDGDIIAFRTFMTGEFFQLLSTMSVLKNSISIPFSLEDPGEKEAFIKGVRAAGNANLLHESFMVRTNQLFGRFNKKENASYLSGLLIGTEIRDISPFKTMLAAGESLSALYKLALENSGSSINVTICQPADLDKAVIMGQLTIFKKITGAI
ncbi:MAG: 2-dehydro-3-deoxygalactonokinase [Chitinophagaceae bacterium]|nr:MAG: 2-dehydro-3-deoxygalactonokinase [Chitinophagaceae bacterium]